MFRLSDFSFIPLLIFGSIFICVGAFIFLMAIDFIHVPEENFNGPRWVVAVVGITFSLAGILATLNGLKAGYGDLGLFRWMYNIILIIFIILFAIPFHLVAFRGNHVSGSSWIGIGNISILQSSGADLTGRIAFCFGSVLMDIFIVYIIIRIFLGKNISDKK